MAILQSHGADRVVTGSCHLLKLKNGMRILIDCGMYQGQEERRNWEPFGFNPKKVDALLITHAHLDHVGRIPKLIKEGFRGQIYATEATFELADIVLLDSAKLMEEDYNTRYKKALRRGEEKSLRPPLYTVEDVQNVWLRPTIHVSYDKWFRLGKGVRARYRNAGHILGSAFIEIEYRDGKGKKRIVFSGDLGNKVEVVMPATKRAKIADSLVIESTYGDRDHRPLKESIQEFKKIVRDTLLNRGNVIIPSFAIERTQDLLCVLKQMYKDRELPHSKVFLDTPMGIRATNIFNKYVDQLSPRCQKFYKQDGEVFQFPGLIFTPDVEDSKRINEIARGAIIIAGSGMCTGGRILHHFKHHIWNRRNAVIFVGYQAKGTIGRELIEGAKWIKIYHEDIRVRATIHTINGFSAHADQDELIGWMRAFRELGDIYLVHGELEKQLVLKKAVRKRMRKDPIIVEEGKEYRLA